MPSLAVDRVGDMAIGYTKSNSTTHPQIKYAGRLAGDAGQHLQSERADADRRHWLAERQHVATTCSRWGDYSGMALDPNGCEFWETAEYYATTGLNHQNPHRVVPLPGLHHGRQRDAQRDSYGRRQPVSGCDRDPRQSDDDDERERRLFVHRPSRHVPDRDRGRWPDSIRHRPTTLVVPNGGPLTRNFSLSAAAQSGCFTDNTQSGFQRGVPSNCNLVAQPGPRRSGESGQHGSKERHGQSQRLFIHRYELGRPDLHADGHGTAEACRCRALLRCAR